MDMSVDSATIPLPPENGRNRGRCTKDHIYSVFSRGKFAVRAVTAKTEVERAQSRFRSIAEGDSLGPAGRNPRPCTLLSPHVAMRSFLFGGEPLLGLEIDDEKILYAFKTDVLSSERIIPYANDSNVKPLPCSLPFIHTKFQEMNTRRTSLYQETTTGHYRNTGEYKAGKNKDKSKAYYGKKALPHNEIILSDYSINDIICFVITSSIPIISANRFSILNWLQCIQSQAKIEEACSMDKRLIAFYHENKGEITGIYSVEDILGGMSIEACRDAVDHLTSYCIQEGLNTKKLSGYLWFLGPENIFGKIQAITDYGNVLKEGANIKNPLSLFDMSFGVKNIDGSTQIVPIDPSSPANKVIADLFSLDKRNPVIDIKKDSLDILAQKILDCYYLTPHPSQIKRLVRHYGSDGLTRQIHGVDHVIRTMRLNQVINALFKEYFPAEYKQVFELLNIDELLPLAMVYHDVVAEVEPKKDEEDRAAYFFERDMKAAGYDSNTVEIVASALRNKNTNVMSPPVKDIFTVDEECSPEERCIRRLLRLPDCIDIIRCTIVPAGFPQTDAEAMDEGYSKYGMFDSQYMDLDESMKNDEKFMEKMHDIMDAALNLAYVSGGRPLRDLRQKNYLEQYKLRSSYEDNQIRQRSIHYSANACQAMDKMIDDNVKRWIATEAGIEITAQAELDAIELPLELTLLDKFMLNDPGVKVKCQWSIHRLTALPAVIGQAGRNVTALSRGKFGDRNRTIPMSDALQAQISSEYPVDFVKDSRKRGHDADGNPHRVPVEYPVKRQRRAVSEPLPSSRAGISKKARSARYRTFRGMV